MKVSISFHILALKINFKKLLACDSNCVKCDITGKGKCDDNQCELGFFLDPTDKKCYKNNPNCLKSRKIGEITVCESCNKTQVLSKNECKDCPIGCDGCTESSGTFICSSCLEQYYKTDSLCRECPNGCLSCSLNNDVLACSVCAPGFGLKGDTCDPCNVESCKKCSFPEASGLSSCDECDKAHFLNADDCGSCPKFCRECIYNGKYTCSKCQEKYAKAIDGTCIACQESCESCVARADKTTKCSKCISNKFTLGRDGVCRTCSENIFRNCSTCEDEKLTGGKAKCLTCDQGFTLKDDKSGCVECSIEHCRSCNYGRICKKCKKGTYLHNFDRECASMYAFLKF